MNNAGNKTRNHNLLMIYFNRSMLLDKHFVFYIIIIELPTYIYFFKNDRPI